jgi:2-polyprenyl-3-methyl-5-hydroxy-6-metoxy-1,4-benzoquinol methylase
MKECSLPGVSSTFVERAKTILLCPICKTQDWRHSQNIRRAPISKCAHCGLLGTTAFLEGMNTAEELYETPPEHYAWYREHYLSSRLLVYERMMPRLDRFRQNGCLLEIGCSYGDFLGVARAAGWDAKGVEISTHASQVARSKGFTVYRDFGRELSLRPGSIDVIAMWDVIEHLMDVGEIIEQCVALLRPGGALIARTPDARALQGTTGFLGTAYRHLAYPANTPEHVFHFTPETLSLLLTQKRFQEIETDTSGEWEERPVSGGNPFVRFGRYILLRYAYLQALPYEFVVTAVKEQ